VLRRTEGFGSHKIAKDENKCQEVLLMKLLGMNNNI
jgi:hypothetical protein